MEGEKRIERKRKRSGRETRKVNQKKKSGKEDGRREENTRNGRAVEERPIK